MQKQEEKITANDFTNVKDVKGSILYTKDDYIISYLRVFSYNIDLLSYEEKKSKTTILAASFEGDRKDWVYVTYPREIDLDIYMNDLKKKHDQEMESIGRRHIVQEMIMEAAELSSSGENYEHQHFIKIWSYLGKDTLSKNEKEVSLRMRAEEFKGRYADVGINTEILKEKEILKMCNLFGNSFQAPFMNVDNDTLYEAMTRLR